MTKLLPRCGGSGFTGVLACAALSLIAGFQPASTAQGAGAPPAQQIEKAADKPGTDAQPGSTRPDWYPSLTREQLKELLEREVAADGASMEERRGAAIKDAARQAFSGATAPANSSYQTFFPVYDPVQQEHYALVVRTWPDSLVVLQRGGDGLEIAMTHYDFLMLSGKFMSGGNPFSDVRRHYSFGLGPNGITMSAMGRFSFPWVSLAVVAAVFLSVGGLLLQRSLRLRRLRKSREKERDAALRTLDAERSRISRELHDGPLQEVYAARNCLIPHPGTTLNQEDLDRTLDTLQSVIMNVRAVCADLKPPALEHLGLEAALSDFLKNIEVDHPLTSFHTTLNVDDQVALREGVDTQIFRVVQEAVFNAMKHGRPTIVRTDVEVHLSGTRIVVANDGAPYRTLAEREAALGYGDGVDLGKRLPSWRISTFWSDGDTDDEIQEETRAHGNGLLNIRDRVESMGGTFEIGVGSGGEGAILSVWVPGKMTIRRGASGLSRMHTRSAKAGRA